MKHLLTCIYFVVLFSKFPHRHTTTKQHSEKENREQPRHRRETKREMTETFSEYLQDDRTFWLEHPEDIWTSSRTRTSLLLKTRLVPFMCSTSFRESGCDWPHTGFYGFYFGISCINKKVTEKETQKNWRSLCVCIKLRLCRTINAFCFRSSQSETF